MAPRVRKKLSPFSARGTPRDRDPREEAMARQGTTRFKREDIDTDQKRGFFGDLAQMGRDLSGYDQVKDSGFVKDLSQMGRDLIVDPVKKYLPGLPGGIQRGVGSLTNNWVQNEENEEILGNAYSDEVRKEMMSPSDREFYEKYMRLASFASGDKAEEYRKIARTALENAQTTRRVNYALGEQPFGFDTSAEAAAGAWNAAEGRQETEAERLARSGVDYGGLSERLQSGLEGTKSGRKFLSDVIPKGEALRDTGMIGNAAANIARAQAEGRAGFATPEARSPFWNVQIKPKPPYKPEGWDEQFLFPEVIDDEVIDITPPGFGEQLDYDELSGEFFPREAYQQSGVFGRGEAPMSPEESQLLMDLYTDPFHGDPYYRREPTPITHVPPNPTIDQIAGTGYTDYRGVNPFREPYLPMEGPSPVPLPPYLSADTDWWTPEPEEEDLRGWDWLNEPVMRHYGAGRPSEEIEREWPNTPPPGYGRPPWYRRAWDWMQEGPWPTY